MVNDSTDTPLSIEYNSSIIDGKIYPIEPGNYAWTNSRTDSLTGTPAVASCTPMDICQHAPPIIYPPLLPFRIPPPPYTLPNDLFVNPGSLCFPFYVLKLPHPTKCGKRPIIGVV